MSVSELKEACEAVVNANPSDYEAACEVWTRVCTPQAVLAALPGTCGTCVNWAEDEVWCTELVCSMSYDEWCSRYEAKKETP